MMINRFIKTVNTSREIFVLFVGVNKLHPISQNIFCTQLKQSNVVGTINYFLSFGKISQQCPKKKL
ncbi:hypothetical protein BpHYR1_046154 [Brachionus plicatilis]|uniref:Uncharacterized protein n=1 Tax=Brachionus plicatilis TaxID=10195 RepID=A0A3M7P3C9_BRAPC|nr:hypothetical protein BpHYR1_046154 [Brachionus plicatilis]